MPRKPPTPRITSSTLPDLSTINSSMSPIFSLLSLYTLTPITLEARHWPSLWTAVLTLERSVVASCARAVPLKSAAPSNAAARYFDFISVSSVFRVRGECVLFWLIDVIRLSVMQQHDQDDQWDWYPNQPQKNRHWMFLSLCRVVNEASLFCPKSGRAGLRLRSPPASPRRHR